MINPMVIGEWIKNNGEGFWKFVGVSDKQEVFVENLKDLGEPEQLFFNRALKFTFPEISKTIFVVKPSLTQMEEMVQQLNQLLRQEEAAPNLLGIGSFNG